MTSGGSSEPVFPSGDPGRDPQRPAMIPLAQTNYLFHDVGPSWGRVRDIKNHKGGKEEGNFNHLNDKFVGPGEE